VTAKLSDLDTSTDNYRVGGLYIVDTSTDEYVQFGKYLDTATPDLAVVEADSLTAASSTPIVSIKLPERAFWLRVAYDGTDLVFSFSMDGEVWLEVGTLTAATYFTNGPTRAGFGVFHVLTDTVVNKVGCTHFLVE
jgi:hypothetical protein